MDNKTIPECEASELAIELLSRMACDLACLTESDGTSLKADDWTHLRAARTLNQAADRLRREAGRMDNVNADWVRR